MRKEFLGGCSPYIASKWQPSVGTVKMLFLGSIISRNNFVNLISINFWDARKMISLKLSLGWHMPME